jgi:ribonuclease D
MQDVCAWREINAIRLNINRGRLLRDECILKMGLNFPKTVNELKVMADSHVLTDDLLKELFSISQIALNKPKATWPEAPKKQILSSLARQRLEILRDKLNEVATSLNVPARLIAPKQDLIALAEEHLEGNRIMNGWRYEIFGHIVEGIFTRMNND